jgi:DNA-binding NtrC family response regulator
MSSPKTALIIEDDPVYQELYAEALQRSHWSSVLARNLYEARSLLEQRTYDAYLIDIHIPGAFSGEVVQLVIQHDPDARTKSVVVTGFGVVAKAFADGIPIVNKASMSDLATFLATLSPS